METMILNHQRFTQKSELEGYVYFYPESETAQHAFFINATESDFYCEWDPVMQRFEFREEIEFLQTLKSDLMEAIPNPGGWFDIG